ncbi:MAG: cellulose binding domain-containing protein [Caldilineaceae bacterium]
MSRVRERASMIKRIRNYFKQEKGVSALYFALILFVLIGMASVAIDSSNANLQRRLMQTAADTADWPVRAMALEKDQAVVDAEVQEMAGLNGADSALWQPSADSKGLTVSVSKEYDTYFARMMGYNQLTATSSSSAGYASITGMEDLFVLAINGCDCLKFDEFPVQIDKDDFGDIVMAIYKIGNVNDQTFEFTFNLRGLDSTVSPISENRPYYMFEDRDNNGIHTVYGNGTARTVEIVRNVNGDGFMADLRYSGRVSTPPAGSPTCDDGCPDTTGWYYYTEMEGTLTGLPGTRYEGAVLNVSRNGAAMQVGNNAQILSPVGYLGAFNTLTLDVVQQPTTGAVLNTGIDGAVNAMLLLPTDGSGDPPTETPTPEATEPGSDPTATNTPQPTATNTPQPTATNTPQPTATNTPIANNGCAVNYKITNDWWGGYLADVTIYNNTGQTINGWELTWKFPSTQNIVNLWNASYNQNGRNVAVDSPSNWNNVIYHGGFVSFGFQGSFNGSQGYDIPNTFYLNGTLCSNATAGLDDGNVMAARSVPSTGAMAMRNLSLAALSLPAQAAPVATLAANTLQRAALAAAPLSASPFSGLTVPSLSGSSLVALPALSPSTSVLAASALMNWRFSVRSRRLPRCAQCVGGCFDTGSGVLYL